jgi:hypothetical protein
MPSLSLIASNQRLFLPNERGHFVDDLAEEPADRNASSSSEPDTGMEIEYHPHRSPADFDRMATSRRFLPVTCSHSAENEKSPIEGRLDGMFLRCADSGNSTFAWVVV